MVQAFLHKIHQVKSMSTTSFIAKLQKSLEPFQIQVQYELAENSFVAPTIRGWIKFEFEFEYELTRVRVRVASTVSGAHCKE